jgi:hypothetical protein
MPSSTFSIAEQAREQDRVFQATFNAARQARARLVTVRPHRAITPLQVTPWLLAQALVLPLLLCTLLVLGKPALLDFWRACIQFWSDGLDLPRTLLSGGPGDRPLPGLTNLIVTTAVTLLALGLSVQMKHEKLPLKYPLRIVCVVQLVTLAYFWFIPERFPYGIASHSEELMTIGYVVMLATPVMLAMGYYILNVGLAAKLFHTALILLFFAVMIPHQVLVQAFIMQHLSVLFMPVLYICFGAVFDALVFVALYSWAASLAPSSATV